MKKIITFMAIAVIVHGISTMSVLAADESLMQALNEAIADYNKASSEYDGILKQYDAAFAQYERDFIKSHANHTNEQIDAYHVWQKYRNVESENAYLSSLTGGEYDVAMELEDRKEWLNKWRTKLLNYSIYLNKWREKLKGLEEKTYRQLDYEARAAAQKKEMLDNAFWKLYEQNMRTGDMMRQNALDRLWPQR